MIQDGDYDREADSLNSKSENLAEMLEPHLAEVKHQSESKL
jgi:hypothetical protein